MVGANLEKKWGFAGDISTAHE